MLTQADPRVLTADSHRLSPRNMYESELEAASKLSVVASEVASRRKAKGS